MKTVTLRRQRRLSSTLMPTISFFYGITIRMYWGDHPPAHFHAIHGDSEAVIEIATLRLTRGAMPRRALALVLEWASMHRDELMEDWNLCANELPPKKIPPLE